jgi:hydroxymethylpyrimidine pyrophosphatase-like HAD family hydrolase
MNDTIAVGDGLNDIDMLKASKIGIAVGNACEELKSVADMVTGNIEDGGIYEAFQALKLF